MALALVGKDGARDPEEDGRVQETDCPVALSPAHARGSETSQARPNPGRGVELGGVGQEQGGQRVPGHVRDDPIEGPSACAALPCLPSPYI